MTRKSIILEVRGYVGAHNALFNAAHNVIWKLNRKTDQGWAKIDINDVVIRELKNALGID